MEDDGVILIGLKAGRGLGRVPPNYAFASSKALLSAVDLVSFLEAVGTGPKVRDPATGELLASTGVGGSLLGRPITITQRSALELMLFGSTDAIYTGVSGAPVLARFGGRVVIAGIQLGAGHFGAAVRGIAALTSAGMVRASPLDKATLKALGAERSLKAAGADSVPRPQSAPTPTGDLGSSFVFQAPSSGTLSSSWGDTVLSQAAPPPPSAPGQMPTSASAPTNSSGIARVPSTGTVFRSSVGAAELPTGQTTSSNKPGIGAPSSQGVPAPPLSSLSALQGAPNPNSDSGAGGYTRESAGRADTAEERFAKLQAQCRSQSEMMARLLAMLHIIAPAKASDLATLYWTRPRQEVIDMIPGLVTNLAKGTVHEPFVNLIYEVGASTLASEAAAPTKAVGAPPAPAATSGADGEWITPRPSRPQSSTQHTGKQRVDYPTSWTDAQLAECGPPSYPMTDERKAQMEAWVVRCIGERPPPNLKGQSAAWHEARNLLYEAEKAHRTRGRRTGSAAPRARSQSQEVASTGRRVKFAEKPPIVTVLVRPQATPVTPPQEACQQTPEAAPQPASAQAPPSGTAPDGCTAQGTTSVDSTAAT